MAPPDALFLGHMLAAIDRIAELIERTEHDEFMRDWVIQDALMRQLEILGEAAGKVSSDFVRAYPGIPWSDITGLRHKLIHDYFEVDLDVVWRTATINVPEVAPLISAAAQEITDDG